MWLWASFWCVGLELKTKSVSWGMVNGFRWLTGEIVKNEVLYLAGPMRGLPKFNFDSFAEGRAKLRALGWKVICPAERDEARGFDPTGLTGSENLEVIGFNLAEALEQCFRDVLEADAVALLPGWNKSEGARAEALIANLTGRQVYEFYGHRPQVLVELTTLDVKTRVEAIR